MNNNINHANSIAALDMGSNSFHLLVLNVQDEKLIVQEKGKIRVRLAAYITEDNVLSEEGMQRGIDCLAEFAVKLVDLPQQNIRLVATQALRQVTNADEFLKRAKQVIPYPINIISGNEESRLIYVGVAQNFALEGRKLVIDIGGGSTEISIGDDFEPLLTESHKIGCISYSHKYFPDNKISKKAFTTAVQNVHSTLTTSLPDYRQLGWQHAIGCSGTIKAVREVLLGLGYSDGVITFERLKKIASDVVKLTSFNQLKFKGLSEERRPVFVAGLAILYGVFETLEINSLVFSEAALREGVLHELHERLKKRDIRQIVLENLVQKYSINVKQALCVQNTAKMLYQQWRQQYPNLGNEKLEKILNCAAYLHEIGGYIEWNNIEKYSAYIIKHSEMPTFSREQKIILACLLRSYRKNIKLDRLSAAYTIKKKIFFPTLLILRLAVILQIERKLLAGLQQQVNLLIDGENWTLQLNNKFAEQHPQILQALKDEQKYWLVFKKFNLVVQLDQGEL